MELSATIPRGQGADPSHAIMLKPDLRAGVQAAILQGNEKAATVRALRGANFHVTVEWFNPDSTADSKWYSNSETWEKKPEDFVEDDAAGA